MMIGSAAAGVSKFASRTMMSCVRAAAEYPWAPDAPVYQLLLEPRAPLSTESLLSTCQPPEGGQLEPIMAFCTTSSASGAMPVPQ